MSAYHRVDSVSVITQAANHFLASLTPEQKAIAVIPFDSEERENWFYTPVPRKGLQLREMAPYQKRLAAALLASGLSQQGFIKAETIMSLEDVLRLLEKDDGERRNPEKYYFSIFGELLRQQAVGISRRRPSRQPELHHYRAAEFRDTPSFFGSNPREVLQGPRKGLRVLAQEEDLARSRDGIARARSTEDCHRGQGSLQGYPDHQLPPSRPERPAVRPLGVEDER